MINRRKLVSAATAIPIVTKSQTPGATPESSNHHSFTDLRSASMYFRTRQYDVANDLDGSIFTLHSWACGFLAHPASRSTFRKFPNLFGDGEVVFSLPGLPTMHSEFIERSDMLFGEDAVLTKLSSVESEGKNGALAMCLNGVLVQLLCIEPAEGLDAEDAVAAVRTITAAIQDRDPEFHGRGEMTRSTVFDHVASVEDIKLSFPHVRLREERYVFEQDDGLSDFWE